MNYIIKINGYNYFSHSNSDFTDVHICHRERATVFTKEGAEEIMEQLINKNYDCEVIEYGC